MPDKVALAKWKAQLPKVKEINMRSRDTHDTRASDLCKMLKLEDVGLSMRVLTTDDIAHALRIIEQLKETGELDSIRNEEGFTLLMLAARLGQVTIVTSLIQAKVNLEAKSRKGNTALMLAANREHPDIVRILLNLGASVAHVNDDGNNALLYALDSGYDVASMLIKAGVDVTEKGFLGLVGQALFVYQIDFYNADIAWGDAPCEEQKNNWLSLLHYLLSNGIKITCPRECLSLFLAFDQKDPRALFCVNALYKTIQLLEEDKWLQTKVSKLETYINKLASLTLVNTVIDAKFNETPALCKIPEAIFGLFREYDKPLERVAPKDLPVMSMWS